LTKVIIEHRVLTLYLLIDFIISSLGGVEKLAVGHVVFALQENLLAFGPVLCNNTTGGKGVMERIKITNPTKIDCKVRFFIGSSTAALAAPVDPKAKAPAKGAAPPTVATVEPQVKFLSSSLVLYHFPR
jgi:hypothetical protein